MKNLKLFIIALLIGIPSMYSQEVQGKITFNNSPNETINTDDPYVVNLFKYFKTGKHKIMFTFKGDYPSKGSKPEFSFFKFKTTVKHNGKTIKVLERDPMPYLPGDMLIPTEAYDFIYILSVYKQDGMSYSKNTGAIPKGRYEIIIEAVPIEVEGSINKGVITLNIN